MVGDSTPVAEVLDWDSRFFGFKIGRACAHALTAERVEQLDSWCHREGVRCLYFLARSDDPATALLAGQNGFGLVDVRMTFAVTLPLEAHSPDPVEVTVRAALDADRLTLKEIARESHHGTRFYQDGRFSSDDCDRLYETWIDRSCQGWADAVLVAEQAEAPVGYVTCHLDGRSKGHIGLLGVASRARGSGAGTALVRSALGWFARREVRGVTVVTQGANSAARQLYQGCGFSLTSTMLWYHRWYDEGG